MFKLKFLRPIVAPLLTSQHSKYSTFLIKTDQNEEAYYKIYDKKDIGCFKVAGVKESFMVDLNDQQISDVFNQPNVLAKAENNDLIMNELFKSASKINFQQINN